MLTRFSLWGVFFALLAASWVFLCHFLAVMAVFSMLGGRFQYKFLQETRLKIRSRFSFTPCSAAVRAQHIRRLPKGEHRVSNPGSYIHISAFIHSCFKFMLQIQCMHDFPHPMFLPPDPHIPPHFVRSLLLRLQNAIFSPS